MNKSIVLLSGGMDSATALSIAKSKRLSCYALTINYGQKHSTEIEKAKLIANHFQVIEHKIIEIDLTAFGGSALTDKSIDIPEKESQGIPVTYVPARNTIMMSLAMAWAESIDCSDIFIGVNAVDYSGYPDCREEYISSFQKMANLATKKAVEGDLVKIHTPLIKLSKKEIILKGIELGVDYSLTISCYQVSSEGLACGKCDSCRLRKAGFKNAGLPDPTKYL